MTERIETNATSADRTWAAGGLAVCVLLVALGWIAFEGDLVPLSIALRAAGLVLAIVAAAACQLYWRVTGEAAGYLIATAGWLIATSIVAGLTQPSTSPGSIVMWSAPLLLAAVWAGRAIIGPTVDAANGPLRQLVVAGLSLTVVWSAATGLVTALDVTLRTLTILAHVGTAVAWTIVAALGLLRALRGTSVLRAWSTWMAVCLTMSVMARLLGSLQGGGWIPIAGALRLSALMVIAVGAAIGLSRSSMGRRDALYEEALRHSDERRRRDESEREHDHEIRTALLAIEGAALTLERHREHLDAEQREWLTGAVRSGMEHLRSLTIAQPTPAEREILAVIEDRIALARSRGLTVDLRQTGGRIEGRCDPRTLAQVIDNLLTNGERHGGRHGPVRIVVEVAGGNDEVVLRISDDGPGIPVGEHERIFEHGYRLHRDAGGEGIGLPVARRLLREQGGDLVVKPSVRGACFEVRLPLPPVSAVADEPQDGRQIVETVDTGVRAALAGSPDTRGRPVIQYHRQLGSRLWRRGRSNGEVEDLVTNGHIHLNGDLSDLHERRARVVTDRRRRR